MARREPHVIGKCKLFLFYNFDNVTVLGPFALVNQGKRTAILHLFKLQQLHFQRKCLKLYIYEINVYIAGLFL